MKMNDQIPLPPDHEERRRKAREKYAALDRRGKLLADLRALADAPGHTATIIGCAADELEMAWAATTNQGNEMTRDLPSRRFIALAVTAMCIAFFMAAAFIL